MALAKFTMLGRLLDQADPYEFTQTFTLSTGYEKNILELKISTNSTGRLNFQGLTSAKYLYVEVLSALSTDSVRFAPSAIASDLNNSVGGVSVAMIDNALFTLKNGEWAMLPIGKKYANSMYWLSWSVKQSFIKVMAIGL